MPADLVHLVRHGEVYNPGGVLYGTLAGFGLSERGRAMAVAAAESLVGHPIAALYSSPLQRTRESAQPWTDLYGLQPAIDARLIEPWNRFEGKVVRREVRKPKNWLALAQPWKPGWGEAYVSIAARMLGALTQAYENTTGGEAVLVSHQLPIWMVVRQTRHQPLIHNPAARRCALSSVTTFAFDDGAFHEVEYHEPAAGLLAGAVDKGAA